MAKTLIGTVSSDKADKTIVVTTVTRKTHPIYKKQYTQHKKFMAHDEKNEAKTGDKVAIVETRPLSARKRYTLDRVIERPVLREAEVAKDAAIETDVQDKGGSESTTKEAEA